MREYSIVAMLLDRDDPIVPIAALPGPLISPTEDERDGYVPNVVYSCGSLVHNSTLIVPYGIADCRTSFATIGLDELLGAMEDSRARRELV